MRYGTPVHRARRGMGNRKARDHIVVPALRVGELFLDECDPREAVLERGNKVAVRQISFQTNPFPALTVEQKHARRPHRVKAMEPSRMFFDVGLYRQEILLNEVGSLRILIRFGIQPSTSASRRRRAEIKQNGTMVLPSVGERLINIFTPDHSHIILRRANCREKIMSAPGKQKQTASRRRTSFCQMRTVHAAACGHRIYHFASIQSLTAGLAWKANCLFADGIACRTESHENFTLCASRVAQFSLLHIE